MLIVGLPAKLRRLRHANRQADTWWLHLSPVISQLYYAGGYAMLVDTAITEEEPEKGLVSAVRVTCRSRCVRKGVGERDHPDVPTARLWIDDDLLRGTLRLPALALLHDWPDTIEGFLSAHDPPIAGQEAGHSAPYLVWKGTR